MLLTRPKQEPTMNNYLKPIRHAAVLGMLAVLFVQCGEQASRDQMEARAAAEAEAERIREEIRAERELFSNDLKARRDALDQRLDELDAQLADAKLDAKRREALTVERMEVAEKRSAVDKAWNDVQNATEETWKDVKQGVSNTATDVGDWFERQVDKVDAATDADADNDGK